jgi:hypothetical protein
MVDRPRVPALPLFVIATSFGVSSTIQAYSIRVLEDGNASVRALLPLLGLNLVYWYVPALLAPTIMAVALRYRLGRVRWSTQIAVHLAGVVVYSLLHTTVLLAARWVRSRKTAGDVSHVLELRAPHLPDAARLPADDVSVRGGICARAGVSA